jgi:hypothetical protein
VYLEVIGTVGKLVKAALGQDSPDWRVLNACPACSYEVFLSFRSIRRVADFE